MEYLPGVEYTVDLLAEKGKVLIAAVEKVQQWKIVL